MSDSLLWELSRGSALVAWAFLVLAVVGGALPRLRQPRSAAARRALVRLHPVISACAVALTVLHVATIALDGQAGVGLVGALLPLAADRDPVGVAWGVIALWLLAAATLAALLRRRLPRRVWTAIHLAAYPCAWVAAVHAATSGTDMGSPALRAAGVLLVAAGSAVALTRSLAGGPGAPSRTASRHAASAR